MKDISEDDKFEQTLRRHLPNIFISLFPLGPSPSKDALVSLVLAGAKTCPTLRDKHGKPGVITRN